MKLLLKISAITFVQLAVYYIIPYFILLSLGVTHVNVIMVISMHVLIVMVVSLFPIPGGAGGAEYSFSVIFSSFIGTWKQVSFSNALWRIVTYYFGMLSGLIAMLIQPKRIVTKNRLYRKGNFNKINVKYMVNMILSCLYIISIAITIIV